MTKPYQPPRAAPVSPACLDAVPSPLTTHGDGRAWIPARALVALHDREGAPAPTPEALAAAVATWSAYRDALKRAMLADLQATRAAPPCALGDETNDLVLTHYHRARLGAYTAALGDDGRDLFRIQRGDMAFAAALNRKTRGAITPDLCPDLPRRLDLTDDAVDAVRDLERGAITWRRLQRRLEPSARAAVREALDDMGWDYGMRGD